MGIGFGSDRVGFQIAELSTALVAGDRLSAVAAAAGDARSGAWALISVSAPGALVATFNHFRGHV
jgi:hypothetical protein